MRVFLGIMPGLLLLIGLLAFRAASQAESGFRELPIPEGTLAERRLKFAVTDLTGFTRLGAPSTGDWLDRFPEAIQSFEEYVASRPVHATPDCLTLAFLPVGEFPGESANVAKATYEFAGIWYGLPVRVLDHAELPGREWSRERGDFRRDPPLVQYRTEYFLRRLLPRKLRADILMLSGITMGDLYPDESWNYVFGQATFRRRVAVYSLARYFPEFWGEEATPASLTLALRRSLKLVTHELGHTFGLRHCVEFMCNMNGSNSLGESDRQPLRLCPSCVRKLQWNRGFDVLGRYRALLEFYDRHGLVDEAAWTRERIRGIASVE